jgi:hypothetical protein
MSAPTCFGYRKIGSEAPNGKGRPNCYLSTRTLPLSAAKSSLRRQNRCDQDMKTRTKCARCLDSYWVCEWHDDTDEDQAKKDAEKWGQQTHDLIAAAYGEGEAALFLDDSGYVFYSMPLPTNTIRNWIDGRMRRLAELLKRTDTLSIRTDFDPAKFK